ncbi:MAG: Gfo/Idh/MocA family oxidoreductase [Terracidiphilus sp.]
MIRVGMIGFGLAGRVFHAPLISSVEGLELAAVLERSTELAAERYPGIRVHRTLDSLLADDSLQLIVVASPTGSHFEVARTVLAAGRHAVVDKPLCPNSAQIAELAALADARGLLLVPFHNRLWDSDFRTIQKVLREGSLGQVVHLQSVFDRWSPGTTRRPWKDSAEEGGGLLHDLGTHLVYQALALFGLPEGVSAEVLRERPGEGANDSFTLRLRYPGLLVTLAANNLSALCRPRFHLRGTRGNYWKQGVDPQESALGKLTRIDDPAWGREPAAAWGTLAVDAEGALVTRPVEPIPGDYRLFYQGIRDAMLGDSAPPATAEDAWRAARLLEWAQQSSAERREIACAGSAAS